MKLTVLEMTQNILSAMDSDEVNSIGDTVESVQVAETLRECFYDLMTQREWPFLRYKTSLVGLGDTTKPSTMQMPTTINKLYWVKYNKKDITYMEPQEFQNMLDLRVEQVGVVDADGIILNRDPEYWTSFDDDFVVFDAVDKAVETTLTQARSVVYALKSATWTHDDDFTPDIPDKFFPTLVAEAKATCFVNIKQQGNQREERKAQRGRVMLNNEVWRNQNGETKYNTLVNYGRKK